MHRCGYLLHLASSGAGAAKINGTASALRFFFDVTLDCPEIVRHLPFAREPRKAPVVLSPEEWGGCWRRRRASSTRRR